MKRRRVGSLSTGIENEGGICIITKLRRHAAGSAVCVCDANSVSGRHRVANADGSPIS